MKKKLARIIGGVLIACIMCGCGQPKKVLTIESIGGDTTSQTTSDNPSASSTNPGTVTNTDQPQTGDDQVGTTPVPVGGLQVLCDGDFPLCSNENGYYYITRDSVQIADGQYGKHLMYVDYATQQEVYLCADSACRHNTANCTSILSEDEIDYDSRIFMHNNYLFVLSRDYDNDGSSSSGVFDAGGPVTERTPCLYRMNPDGTGREKIYTFPSGFKVESQVFGDESGIYFIIKKLKSEKLTSMTYTTSSERKLIRVNPSDGSSKDMCMLEFDGENSDWDVLGCFDHYLIFEGLVFNKEMTPEEIFGDDDAYMEAYRQSKTVFKKVDINDGTSTDITSVGNSLCHTYKTDNGILYLSEEGSGKIQVIDMTGAQANSEIAVKDNMIFMLFDDTIMCQSWDMDSDQPVFFVDRNTHEIHTCTLRNQTTGWFLDFKADTTNDFLVVYAHEADNHGDGSFEIFKDKFALISKKDLYSSNANYRAITMQEAGF